MRLSSIACVPLACAALAVAGCGGDDSGSTTPTAAPTTQTAAPTTATATTPTTPTQTGIAGATITQVQAKAAARRAASAEAQRAGHDLPSSQWDVKCTAVGGRDRARTWHCQTVSLDGKCGGSVTVSATGPGVAGASYVSVACPK
jgi:hypothetical protein